MVYNNSVDGSNLNISETYTYITDYYYGESALVSKYTSEVGTSSESYTYTYDKNGNITKIVYSDGKEVVYTYNSFGYLATENNDITGLYYTYAYDDAGNLTKVTQQSQLSLDDDSGLIMKSIGDSAETNAPLRPLPLPTVTTYTYSYTNSEWGDLLTSYNGTTITYDEIGNPLSYYNGSSYTFGWRGRQLISAVKGTDTMSFAYNNSGLRISKTVNGVTTHYAYDGNVLLAEYTDNETIVYIYDANDSPIGFKYRASSYEADVWDVYWYGKNLQGDILHVYNSSGTKLITYTYTAWGKTTITYSNGGASTTAINNNLTYRGYYYDSDLDLYYLQTRYYDPVIGRFINADEYVSTGQKLIGNNMFAYCNNNPVMLLDSMGEKAMPFWELIWPGEIHREIQEYLRDKHHYEIEVTVEGKRIDLVKDNNAYEIKPFSTPLFVALLQLLNYIELSDGKYVLGVGSPELTGSFVSKRGFQVKFYYMGCGIIQYSFYNETSPVEILVPEKDRSQSTGGSVAGIVATVAVTGLVICLADFSGCRKLINPCK